MKWMETQALPPPNRVEYWTIYFGDLIMAPGAEARVVLISHVGVWLRYTI